MTERTLFSRFAFFLSGRDAPTFSVRLTTSGDNEIRTRDLLLARQALSQLSYTPGLYIKKWA